MTRRNPPRRSKTVANDLITDMLHNPHSRQRADNAARLINGDGDSSSDDPDYIPRPDDEIADDDSGSESDEGDGAESVSGDDGAVGLLQDDGEPSDVDMGCPPSFPSGGFDGMMVG
jgi:hypothetical protein